MSFNIKLVAAFNTEIVFEEEFAERLLSLGVAIDEYPLYTAVELYTTYKQLVAQPDFEMLVNMAVECAVTKDGAFVLTNIDEPEIIEEDGNLSDFAIFDK